MARSVKLGGPAERACASVVGTGELGEVDVACEAWGLRKGGEPRRHAVCEAWGACEEEGPCVNLKGNGCVAWGATAPRPVNAPQSGTRHGTRPLVGSMSGGATTSGSGGDGVVGHQEVLGRCPAGAAGSATASDGVRGLGGGLGSVVGVRFLCMRGVGSAKGRDHSVMLLWGSARSVQLGACGEGPCVSGRNWRAWRSRCSVRGVGSAKERTTASWC